MKLPTDTRTRRPIFAIATASAALIALLAVTWSVYHPGLSGDFLFDDFVNLPALGATGPVTHWATFWRYITSGAADPTGRPLTLLTFLIDARNWPASPYPFKVTNVILHLINGVLLAWVLWKLGQVLTQRCTYSTTSEANTLVIPGSAAGRNPESVSLGAASRDRATSLDEAQERQSTDSGSPLRGVRNDEAGLSAGRPNETAIAIAALFGAGTWLLHPLFVSTTLYIVQREAMLPATLVLIGMLGWMASRETLARGHIKRGLIGMGLSAWVCTAFAVLCKANGALLPLLLLLTEWIVLSRQRMPTMETQRWHRRAVGAFLMLPGAVVIAYLLYLLPHSFTTTIDARGWSVAQRLLTDPRVLTDYLRLLFIPHAHSSGLFNDAFPVSTSWTHPASTIPCMALVFALIAVGFVLKKKYPALALALLFYFTAQLMESGWLPLELYFEHRNYLPAMLLFWPIGLALGKSGSLRFLRVLAAAIILAMLAVLTFQRATLWGDGFRQAQVWAAINPDSARAQTNAALYDMQHDRPRLAAARLRLSIPRHPGDIQAPINLIGAECRLGEVRPETLRAAEDALAHARVGGQTAFKWFDEALGLASNDACTGLDFTALQATLDAARRNASWRSVAGRQQDFDHLQGQLDLAEGKPDAALASFDRAIAVSPDPGSALEQAAYLGSHGYPELGLAHLDYFESLPPAPKARFGMPRIHVWVLRKQGWWPNETAYLRKTLETDAATKAAAKARTHDMRNG